MEEIKFDVIERVCEKQNFRELLLHIIKNSSGNRIKKMLEDIENNNKIDKKMKRKIYEEIFDYVYDINKYFERNLKDIEEEKASQVFSKYFKSVPIESVQGASFHNCIFLIDEAQLLDALALKQIMSRLADTSKCVLIMDPKQTYGMNRGREGYRRLLPRCKGNELISFVKLQHIQRSPLTKLVNSIFEDVR
jgi:predicted ribonuclease YlaK